jgi:hypothetical protein
MGGVRLNEGMPISLEDLQQHINQSGFKPDARMRAQALEIIWNGIQLFRENKERTYRSHTGKLVKKPSPSHRTSIGRYDQEPARVILISAICQAWTIGVGQKPTLNNKNHNDSPFMTFAVHILGSEGVGHIHQRLEEYWSIRKHEWLKNSEEPEKWRLSGGSEPVL